MDFSSDVPYSTFETPTHGGAESAAAAEVSSLAHTLVNAQSQMEAMWEAAESKLERKLEGLLPLQRRLAQLESSVAAVNASQLEPVEQRAARLAAQSVSGADAAMRRREEDLELQAQAQGALQEALAERDRDCEGRSRDLAVRERALGSLRESILHEQTERDRSFREMQAETDGLSAQQLAEIDSLRQKTEGREAALRQEREALAAKEGKMREEMTRFLQEIYEKQQQLIELEGAARTKLDRSVRLEEDAQRSAERSSKERERDEQNLRQEREALEVRAVAEAERISNEELLMKQRSRSDVVKAESESAQWQVKCGAAEARAQALEVQLNTSSSEVDALVESRTDSLRTLARLAGEQTRTSAREAEESVKWVQEERGRLEQVKQHQRQYVGQMESRERQLSAAEQSFKDRLQAHERDATAQIAQLELRLAEHERREAALTRAEDEIRSKQQFYDEELRRFEHERGMFVKQRAQLEGQLTESVSEVQHTRQNQGAEVARLQVLQSNLEQQQETLQSRQAIIAQRWDDMKEESDRLQRAAADLQVEQARHAEERKRSSTKASELSHRDDLLETREKSIVEQSSGRLRALEDRESHLQRQEQAVNERSQRLVEEQDKGLRDIRERRNSVESARSALSLSKSEFETSVKQLNARSDEIASLEATARADASATKRGLKEFNDKETQLQRTMVEFAAREGKIARLEHSLRDASNQLEKQREELAAEGTRFKQDMFAQQKQVTKLESDLRAGLRDLEVERGELRREVMVSRQETESQLESSRRVEQDAHREHADVQSRVETLRVAEARLDRDRQLLEIQKQDLQIQRARFDERGAEISKVEDLQEHRQREITGRFAAWEQRLQHQQSVLSDREQDMFSRGESVDVKVQSLQKAADELDASRAALSNDSSTVVESQFKLRELHEESKRRQIEWETKARETEDALSMRQQELDLWSKQLHQQQVAIQDGRHNFETQGHDLDSMQQELSDRIVDLDARNEALEGERALLVSREQLLEDKAVALTEAVDRADKRHSDAVQTLVTLDAKEKSVRQLERQHAATVEDFGRQQQEFTQQVQGWLQKQQSEEHSLVASQEALAAQQSEMAPLTADYNEKRQAMERTAAALEGEVASWQQEQQAQQQGDAARHAALESAERRLEEQQTIAEVGRVETEQARSAMTDELSLLQTQRAAHEEANDHILAERKTWEQEKTQMEQQLSARESEVAGRLEAVLAQQRQLENRSVQVEEEIAARLDIARRDAEQTSERSTAIIKRAELAAAETLSAAEHEASKQRDLLQRDAKALSDKTAVADEKLVQLDDDARAVDATLSEATLARTELDRERSALQAEIKELQTDLVQQQKEHLAEAQEREAQMAQFQRQSESERHASKDMKDAYERELLEAHEHLQAFEAGESEQVGERWVELRTKETQLEKRARALEDAQRRVVDLEQKGNPGARRSMTKWSLDLQQKEHDIEEQVSSFHTARQQHAKQELRRSQELNRVAGVLLAEKEKVNRSLQHLQSSTEGRVATRRSLPDARVSTAGSDRSDHSVPLVSNRSMLGTQFESNSPVGGGRGATKRTEPLPTNGSELSREDQVRIEDEDEVRLLSPSRDASMISRRSQSSAGVDNSGAARGASQPPSVPKRWADVSAPDVGSPQIWRAEARRQPWSGRASTTSLDASENEQSVGSHILRTTTAPVRPRNQPSRPGGRSNSREPSVIDSGEFEMVRAGLKKQMVVSEQRGPASAAGGSGIVGIVPADYEAATEEQRLSLAAQELSLKQLTETDPALRESIRREARDARSKLQ